MTRSVRLTNATWPPSAQLDQENPMYPGTIAKRIVRDLENRGLAKFGPEFAAVENRITEILVEEINRPRHAQPIRVRPGMDHEEGSGVLAPLVPNKTTIAAMKEARRGGLESYKNLAELLAALNDE